MKAHLFFIIAYICFSVIGCSTSTTITQQKPKTETTKQALQPEELISKALSTDSPQLQTHLFFQAAKSYWQNKLYTQSDAALGSVIPEYLNEKELQQYLQISLTIATQSENKNRIKSLLELLPPQDFQHLSIDNEVKFALLLSKAYEILGSYIDSSITLIENRGLIEEDHLPDLDEKIWSLLRSSQTTELSQYEYSGENIQIIAWLDLARSIQLNQINLDEQFKALLAWNKLWPDHPASLNPPHELNVLQQLPNTRPNAITLALPLSGPLRSAGKAIRDGFMARYFNDLQSDSSPSPLKISFFDTAKHQITSLYEENPDQQSSLIIGPLDKGSITSLNALDGISIPTLALNYLPSESKLLNNLYQLGLAPETEAIQLAQHLDNKNLKRIGMILPENNLGFRIYDTFLEHFTKLEGVVVESVFYSDQSSLSPSVARLLGTADSAKRKRKIQAIAGSSLEFLPRRRQDIDALIMIAKPEIARQIKPLFKFHYAADLPVFANSQIHSMKHKGKNEDLEGIEFIEMPWMLSNTIDIKSSIQNAIPESSNQYARFYALGADSYDLAPRLTLLKEVQGSQMQGHTGTLSMNDHGVIERKMQWAKFRKGKATIIRE